MSQQKSACSGAGKKNMYELTMIDNDNTRITPHSKYRYEQLPQSTKQHHEQQPPHQSPNPNHYSHNYNYNQQTINNTTFQLQSLINKQLMMTTTKNNKNFTPYSKMFRNKKLSNPSLFNAHSNNSSIDRWEHNQSPFLIWRKTHYSFKEKHLQKHKPATVLYSPQQQPNNNLQQIRQSLTMLKTKQQYLSPKKSYDEFINRLNKSTSIVNPETKQQLIKELEVSKLGRNVILEREKKSLSVCHKGKSKVVKDKIEGDEGKDMQQQQRQYFISSRVFFDNVRPCKISELKPIRIYPYEKRRSHYPSPSSHLQHITRQIVRKQQKIPQRKANQRKSSQRQALSPYHNELSAWS